MHDNRAIIAKICDDNAIVKWWVNFDILWVIYCINIQHCTESKLWLNSNKKYYIWYIKPCAWRRAQRILHFHFEFDPGLTITFYNQTITFKGESKHKHQHFIFPISFLFPLFNGRKRYLRMTPGPLRQTRNHKHKLLFSL